MASDSVVIVIIVAALLVLNKVLANSVPLELPAASATVGEAVAAAAAAAATTQDQYEMGEDRPRKATDHLLKLSNSINPLTSENYDGSSETIKNKRSYYQYSSPAIQSISAYHSVSIWQPSPYQLTRPYFIPIFGIPGQIPIYYPPQPLFIYPEIPPFKGPEYLPPSGPSITTTKPETDTTPMKIEDRFNFEEPVWGIVATTQSPYTNNNIVPTRRPRPQRISTFPPLIHSLNKTATTTTTTTTSRPNIYESENAAAAAAPPQPQQQAANQQQPQQQVGPSRCVWAIVSCCSRGKNVPTDCFEFHGCPGPFWDASPCESDFAKAAIETALKYYNSK